MEHLKVTFINTNISKKICVNKYNEIELNSIIMFYLRDKRFKIELIKENYELD